MAVCTAAERLIDTEGTVFMAPAAFMYIYFSYLYDFFEAQLCRVWGRVYINKSQSKSPTPPLCSFFVPYVSLANQKNVCMYVLIVYSIKHVQQAEYHYVMDIQTFLFIGGFGLYIYQYSITVFIYIITVLCLFILI